MLKAPTSLLQTKVLLVALLAATALASAFFVDTFMYSGLPYYVFNGFLITECTVVGAALFFDTFASPFYQYKIRKDHVASDELVVRSIWERIYKYRTEWITYAATWLLSCMSFEHQTYPGIATSALQVASLCVLLDFYVYLAHMWMHSSRQGHLCHKKHHSFRYVNCWFVDHESQLESFIIAVGKHGALAVFSPHPQTALEYLFVAKLWNVVAHCGYNLPLFHFVDKYMPFMGTPNRHEQHHYHGEANLSIFTTIFDYFGQTLVWTDKAAMEWRRHQRLQKRGDGEAFAATWKVDPAASAASKII